MTVRRKRGLAITAGLTLGTIACGVESHPSEDAAAVAATPEAAAPVPAPDSAAVASALSVLEAFLEASREGSATRSDLPRLTACSDTDATTPAGPMLAAYRLLPPLARADTVIGRAVVTTVAEQDVDRRHPGYFIARVRVRADTLEWDVVPSGDGSWVVCNGLPFGLTAPDSLTAWRPEGASRATAHMLADSIAGANAARGVNGR